MATETIINCETGEEIEVEIAAPDTARRKAIMTSVISTLRERKFREGFPVSGTGTALDGHTLQTRDAEDRTNWLTSQAAYAAAVAAGHAGAPGAVFRTASNQTIGLTFGQGLAILLGMAAWGKAVMGRSWELKDAVAAAADDAALDAIDLEAGWP